MAKTQAIVITSDLTGEVIPEGQAEHVTFAVNGAVYELDLTKSEAEDFMESIGVYVDKAQIVKGGRRKATVKVPSNAGTVRAWAESQGMDVPKRGRIPKNVQEEYDKAH